MSQQRQVALSADVSQANGPDPSSAPQARRSDPADVLSAVLGADPDLAAGLTRLRQRNPEAFRAALVALGPHLGSRATAALAAQASGGSAGGGAVPGPAQPGAAGEDGGAAGPSGQAAPGPREAGEQVAAAVLQGADAELPGRSRLERAFGQDLSHLRVAVGPEARVAAVALGADAFAADGRIGLAEPNAEPELVAHEVVHTLQRREREGPGQSAPGQQPVQQDQGLEQEAERLARAVLREGPEALRGTAPISPAGPGLRLHRSAFLGPSSVEVPEENRFQLRRVEYSSEKTTWEDGDPPPRGDTIWVYMGRLETGEEGIRSYLDLETAIAEANGERRQDLLELREGVVGLVARDLLSADASALERRTTQGMARRRRSAVPQDVVYQVRPDSVTPELLARFPETHPTAPADLDAPGSGVHPDVRAAIAELGPAVRELPASHPSRSSDNGANIRLIDFSQISTGVQLRQVGSMRDPGASGHEQATIDPRLALRMRNLMQALAGRGVSVLYHQGFWRAHSGTGVSAHNRGWAVDIKGFGLGSGSSQTILTLGGGSPRRTGGGSNDLADGASDWFDLTDHLPDGRTHRQAMVELAQLLGEHFSQVIGPGFNSRHGDHFHCHIGASGTTRGLNTPATPMATGNRN